MKTYQGSCHCGNISFSFTGEEITEGLRCNCSICKRKGALMSPYMVALADIEMKNKDDAMKNHMGVYQFGDRKAKHYYCKNCGIYPFHETMRFPGQCRVNLGCVDGVDTFALTVKVFDGAAL